jgi:hypothetical protein
MTLLDKLELQATAGCGAVGRYAKEAVRERLLLELKQWNLNTFAFARLSIVR